MSLRKFQLVSTSFHKYPLKYLLISISILAILLYSLFLIHNSARADITTGLVGYWKFDEGSGTTAADSSGNNNNGALTNGPTWTVGKIGNALNFDGVDDYVLTPTMAYNSDYSISFWMKTTATAYQSLIGWGYWRRCIVNASGSTGKISCLGTGDNSYSVFSNNAVNDGLWHYVGFTVDSSNNQTLYIDGQYQNTNTHAQVGSSQTIYIGSDFLGGDYFNGLIDEVRIYNRALSASEVLELYSYTGGGTPTPSPSGTPSPTPSPSPSPDVSPPVRSNGSPTGTLVAGTTQTTMSIVTNKNATCRYSTIAGTSYASMTNTFSTTGTTNHSTTITGLQDGQIYNYYIRCQDIAGNTNIDDYTITFSVASLGTGKNIYISQNGTGDGSSCANARAYTWNWSGVTGDDTVWVCGTIANQVSIGASGTSGHPVTLKFCNESECGAGNTGKFSAIIAPAPYGFIWSYMQNNIVVDGNGVGIIEATDNGSSIATCPTGQLCKNHNSSYSAGGVSFYGGNNIEVKNLIIRNIYIHQWQWSTADEIGGNNTKGIFLMEVSNAKIHDNIISHAGVGIHYRNAGNTDLTGIEIYNNTVSHCCFALGIGTGIVGGYADNVRIHDNNIEIGGNWMSGPINPSNNYPNGDDCHLNGFYAWSGASGTGFGTKYTEFYDNYMHGILTYDATFPNGSTWVSTSMFGNDGYADEIGTKVYNNLFVLGPYVDHALDGPTNGAINTGGNGSQIYNNTMIGYNHTSPGIQTANGPTIKNNIIAGFRVGLQFPVGYTNVAADNNSYYDNVNGSSSCAVMPNNSDCKTVPAWQTLLGGCPGTNRECNSIATNPDLNADYTQKVTSPTKWAGTATGQLSSTDKAGATWHIPPSIGAYEYVSGAPPDTTPPSPPQNVSVN